MKRFHPKTGEMFLPWRYKDGRFRVADPSLGEAKKLKENQIAVDDESELAGYVRRGFHVRVRGVSSGQTNLISPEEIVLD